MSTRDRSGPVATPFRPALDRLAAYQPPAAPPEQARPCRLAANESPCDTDAAIVLRERLTPFSEQVVIPTGAITTGAIAHHLGLLATTLGDYEEAEAHFQTAEAIHSRIGAPTLLARTRLEWARMLLARRQPGDAERGYDLLGRALATARELGLGNVERRAVALLQEV